MTYLRRYLLAGVFIGLALMAILYFFSDRRPVIDETDGESTPTVLRIHTDPTPVGKIGDQKRWEKKDSKKRRVDLQDISLEKSPAAKWQCFDRKTDDAGLVLSQNLDSDCDGRPESCTYYAYNQYGDKVRERSDDNCDGQIDSCKVYEYDNYGEKTYLRSGKDCEAPEPFEICFKNKYDDDGFVTRQRWLFGCDESHQLCLNYTYDEQGAWTKVAREESCNGVVNSCATFSFDENGRLTAVEQDKECDGQPDQCNIFSYDPDSDQKLKAASTDCKTAPKPANPAG